MLFLVSTPIGNLGDISDRAKQTLQTVDLIACEDTRVTKQLVELLGLKTPPLTPYHDHNADKARPALLEKLENGMNIALVSDAGTPLVSDPGFKLVRACHERHIPVTSVPGANAVLPALQLSGLPSNAFYFGGFLPAKQQARCQELAKVRNVPATLIFYETASRLMKSLSDIEQVLGARSMAIVREITKKFEEVRHGTPMDLKQLYEKQGVPKGELVLVIDRPPEQTGLTTEELETMILEYLKTHSVRDTTDMVLPLCNRPKKEVYKEVLRYAQKK